MAPSSFPTVKLKKVLSKGQLPAMPQSAIRLLELSQDPDIGPTEFAVPIETDPGLTAQILRFVNSSYFGFRSEISSVKQAITLVGVRTVKNFALYSAVFNLIPDPKCGPFDLQSLWQDSLRRGLFARALGKVLGMAEAEEPFAAALLQDMAVPLLAREVPEAYNRLFGARSESHYRVRLSALEQHVFGWDHAEAAGIMARQWSLPESFAVLIEDHLAVERWAAQPKAEPGKVAVAMSALLPTISDGTWAEQALFEQHYEQVRPADGPSIVELFEKVDVEFADFAPVLRIPVSSHTLSDSYREVCEATD